MIATLSTQNDDGTFHAAVHPSLGEDTRRRLRGCLEDATVDKVRGHLISMSTTTDPTQEVEAMLPVGARRP